jgi:hypothetical protein
MIKNLKETFDYLNNYDLINIVDVGAANGIFKKEILPYITKNNYWIGIEPNNGYNNLEIQKEYDLWFENAIDDVDSRKITQFNINQDAYCSSLLEINKEIITKDINKKDDLWYCPSEISTIISIKNVEVVSLKELFDEMCLWLNKAEKEYSIKQWDSGEGKNIVLDNIEIEFYDTGYVDFVAKEKPKND